MGKERGPFARQAPHSPPACLTRLHPSCDKAEEANASSWPRQVGICRTVRVAPAANIPTRSGPPRGWSDVSPFTKSASLDVLLCLEPPVQLICGKVDHSHVRSRSASTSPRTFPWHRKQLQRYSSYSPSLQLVQTWLRPKAAVLGAAVPGAAVSKPAASRVEVVATSVAVAPMARASTDEDSTDKDSKDKASLDLGSWTAPGTGTIMDMPTGTESLPVTMSALSSASV